MALISIMPNPAQDQVTLQFDLPFSGMLFLQDPMGRIVDATPMEGTRITWSLSQHPAGIYTVRVASNTGASSSLRLVLQD